MKKFLCVISLVVLFCFTFACQNKAEKAELEKFRTQSKVEEQNKALVKRWHELWVKGDFEALKEVAAPEFVWYLPSRSINTKSLEEMIEVGKMLHKAFPDMALSSEEVHAVGDRVIVRDIFRATHQGEFAGIPATGNKLELSGTCIWRIENGKLVEDREEFDMLGMYQQLGLELKPKDVKK
jgi:steroid delta-isomerase-like uncharacterized protein